MNATVTPVEVGERLRAARTAAGLKQAAVAERIGVQRRTLYEWEKGQRVPTEHVPVLADLYGVTPMWLLFGVQPSDAAVADLRGEVAAVKTELALFAEATQAGLTALHDLVLEIARGIAAHGDDDPPQPTPAARRADGAARSATS